MYRCEGTKRDHIVKLSYDIKDFLIMYIIIKLKIKIGRNVIYILYTIN